MSKAGEAVGLGQVQGGSHVRDSPQVSGLSSRWAGGAAAAGEPGEVWGWLRAEAEGSVGWVLARWRYLGASSCRGGVWG